VALTNACWPHRSIVVPYQRELSELQDGVTKEPPGTAQVGSTVPRCHEVPMEHDTHRSGDAPHPGKLLDIVMLVLPGGQERTEAEYGSLLSKAGFRLTRTVQTDSAVSVVEAMLT
jgi:hypothetical protein